MNEDVFRTGVPTGSLVYIESETGEASGYEFEIWFPYTVDLVRMVKRGSFVAVKNFDSRQGSQRYSLLEILEALPTHYALGASRGQLEKTYPGHLVEAARSARNDWEQEEPTESTTKIRCEGEQTGLALHFEGSDAPTIARDNSLPMWGEEARLLSNKEVEKVVNKGLLGSEISTLSPGSLKLDQSIPFHLEVSSLLKTHFGLFGFTGGGKSNALSTISSEILTSGTDATVVFFDLMGEYISLLADLVCQYPQALIVVLDTDSVPGGDETLNYLRTGSGLDRAVESITNTLLLPRDLEGRRGDFKPLIEEMLEKQKIRVLEERSVTGGSLLEEFEEVKSTSSAGRSLVKQHLEEILPDDLDSEVSEDSLDQIDSDLSRVLEHEEVPTDPTSWGGTSDLSGGPPTFEGVETRELSVTEVTDLREFQTTIGRIGGEEANLGRHAISWDKLLEHLDEGGPSLLVVTSDRADQLKEDASRLMSAKYSGRRSIGLKEPQISFLFDEADQFIPNQASDDATRRVKGVVENIARRGRKFGLGIGIATQRATYLDTNIMAQPHTYMISKLPRKEDRERVGDAFGLSRTTLDRTLDFGVGEWLTVSFEATGMVGTPIPVKLKNANERVEDFLDSR